MRASCAACRSSRSGRAGRWHTSGVARPTLPKITTVAAVRSASARLVAVATADRTASYTTPRDMTRGTFRFIAAVCLAFKGATGSSRL
jgi:hypothetical protein